MLKISLNISLFLALLFHTCDAAVDFSFEHKFVLKRNQKARVIVRDLEFEKKYFFDFSWTLYDFTNIIVHSRYRRWPRQFVLSMRRNLDWATQTLVPNLRIPWEPTRLILEFKDFNIKKKTAVFMIYIEDKQGKVEVKFKTFKI